MYQGSILQIETTDLCNLKCIMCHPHAGTKPHPHKNKSNTHMSFETFKKILSSLKKNNIFFDVILLHWLGEPFLNPDFTNFLFYLLKNNFNNFGVIRIDSNFSFKSKSLLLKFLETTTNQVHLTLSIDAISNLIYSEIRKKGDFDLVNKNISYLLQNRRKGPIINVQFIVMEENFHELGNFLNYWISILSKDGNKHQDYISVMPLSANFGGISQWKANNLYTKVINDLNLNNEIRNGVKINISNETSWGEDNY